MTFEPMFMRYGPGWTLSLGKAEGVPTAMLETIERAYQRPLSMDNLNETGDMLAHEARIEKPERVTSTLIDLVERTKEALTA